MPADRKHHGTTRYRDRRSNDPNYDVRIEDTLRKVARSEYSSFEEAARCTGIPRTTLTDRGKRRHNSWETACAKRQLLTPEQEETLVQWCGLRASMGQPWTLLELRAQAEAVSGKTVGQNWHRKFEKRHPELRASKPAKLDPKRAKHFNEAIIGDFYDQWEALNEKHDGIPPEHIWNWDEKGIQMGGGRKKSSKKYYFLKDHKQRYRISSDNLELVTILECVSAAGEVVPPSFCLQNGSRPDLRALSDDEWGSIYFSESGWTDSFNAGRWLDEVFIPFAKERRVDPSKPIVLLMDGHETHETPEMKRVVYKRLDDEDIEIILFCLPSKTTHKMQPLDVAVFCQVERRWQAICDDAIKNKIPINRFTVIPAYVRGTRPAMTPELIKKSFEKTGIYPINRNIFHPEEFAPSKVSSSVAQVPDTFPAHVPSSDPAEPSDAEDEDYNPSRHGDSSDSESESSESDNLANSASDSDLDTDSEMQESRIGDDIDSGMVDICPKTEPEDNTESCPLEMKPISGLIASLAKIEDDVIHMTRSATASIDLFMVAPPKFVPIEDDRKLSPDAMLSELRSLRQNLIGAFQALGRALAQLSASNAHCTTIQRELDHVQQQLQNVTKKKERGSKKIKARFLTARDLRAEFEREDAERQECERIAAEKDKQKEAVNAENARRVADDAANRIFTGRISSYKKDDLRALALALGVSDKDGKREITARIEEKFSNEPVLKTNMRFSGLFEKSSRARHCNVQIHASAVAQKSDSEPESDLDSELTEASHDDHHAASVPLVTAESSSLPSHSSGSSVHPSSVLPQARTPISSNHPVPPHSYPLSYQFNPNYYPTNFTLNHHDPIPQSSQTPQPHYQFQFYYPNPNSQR